jgi:hypothetical protein
MMNHLSRRKRMKQKLSEAFFKTAQAIPTSREDEVRYCCPFCGDIKYHLYYNLTYGLYHCFRCNTSGRVKGTKHVEFLPVGSTPIEIPVFKEGWSKEALEFLKKRDMLIALNYAREGGNSWDGYIVFSVYPEGWIGRKFKPPTIPKYRFTKGAGGIWTDLFILQTHNGRPVYLVEGIFDALRVIQCGYPAIALNGTSLGRGKIELLKSLCERYDIQKLVVMLDADARVESDTMVIKLLYSIPSVKVVNKVDLPTGDPADYSVQELSRLVKEFKVSKGFLI